MRLFTKGDIKNRGISFIIVFLFYLPLLAQQKITGVVRGSNDLPLAGVSVIVKDTRTATVTSAEGEYSINAKAGDIIEFSSVGYNTTAVKVIELDAINVTLKIAAINLDEVVLVGYTYQRVKEIAGSVAIVKPADLTAVPAGQVEQMLQGRVAGLNVITSGMPGSASNVRIHGIGNFGDVTPLYIIDGVQGDINNINPSDIESIQVLKDAGAFAIYGVRGANGAIVITTRSGKNGKSKINYNFYIGTTRPLRKGPDLLNSQEIADLTWLALKNSGQLTNGNPYDPLYGNGPQPVLPDYFISGQNQGLSANDPLVNPDLYNLDFTKGDIYQIIKANKTGTDWFHEVFKPALSQNHTVSVSGGNEKNKYLLSLGYLNQQGTLLNTYLKRFTARINTTFSVNDKIRVGENLQLSYSDNPRIATQQGPNFNEAFGSINSAPLLPVYDIKGGWTGWNPQMPPNVVAQRQIAKNDVSNYWEIFGNAWAEADLLKHFTLKTQFGGTFVDNYAYNFGITGYTGTGANNSRPSNTFSESSGYNRSWTWTNTLNFTTHFLNNNHTIKMLAGIEAISNYSRAVGGTSVGYFTNDPSYRYLQNGDPGVPPSFSLETTSSLYSFISRADYGYKDKIFLTGTLRRDGTSIFSPENRFGWFPSLSAAWRLTEENFLKGQDWLTDLKIRASWGKTGFYGNTDPFNQYTLYGGGRGDSYYDIMGTSNSIMQGFRKIRIGDPRTGWQQDVVINAGFESILWNGKLNITVDVYKKKSTGLLFPVILPDILGGAAPPNVNVGDVENRGIDLLLGSKGQFSKNWSWDATLTLTAYKNKVLHLNEIPFADAPFEQGGSYVRNAVGHPISSYYGYKVTGIFQNDDEVSKSPEQIDAATGRFKYQDTNHDGRITDDDRTFYGDANPDFTMGVNLGLNFKNFDLSSFSYGSFGNDVINVNMALNDFFTSPVGNGSKSKTALYNSWTPTHTNAKAPIQEVNFNNSNNGFNSYARENGTYFRSKSLMLGYSFPPNRMQKIKIEKLRVYIQAVNLFTITKYSGLDPELSGFSAAYGIDFGNYPNNQKQYLIGLSLNF